MTAERKGEGNRVVRPQGVAVNPWSPREGSCSRGSWEELKPLTLQELPRAKICHIPCCSPSLPTLPQGDNRCRSKTSRAARDTWTSTAPLSSPCLGAKPPSACVSMKSPESEQRQAQPNSSPRWLSLLPEWWYLFLFGCRTDRWGRWCLQWDNVDHQQTCSSMGRVDCWRGDFRVPICVCKASVPGELEGGETTHLWWLRREHLGSPQNAWSFNSFHFCF